MDSDPGYIANLFLSTPSARRATEFQNPEVRAEYISIHALREEGDLKPINNITAITNISIHALREEGDRVRPERQEGNTIFLSTPSARRATGHPAGE